MEITAKQFERFSTLVYRESGINLHGGKKQLLQARLARRLRQTGIDSVDRYLKLIRDDSEELVSFLDAVSTNHTYFFREDHHFELVQNGHNNIWCAASSSGEEPYSIAMDCLEKGFQPSILATDISTRVLQIGQNAVYPIEAARKLPTHILRNYFQKGQGKLSHRIRVKDAVRRMVTFRRLNLVTEPAPRREFDLVFCRNVLIYFDRVVKTAVIDKLYGALKLGGYLVIGGAESLNNIEHRYEYVRPNIYRKAA